MSARPRCLAEGDPFGLLKGDYPGHPFRGNQYEDGSAAAEDFPGKASDTTRVKALGGSTGAVLVKDRDGNLFVRKEGASPEHLAEEDMADRVYRNAGVPVPETKVYDGRVKLSAFVEGRSLDSVMRAGGPTAAKAVAALQRDFATDALMMHWDVVGLERDNIVVDKKGTPWRIDNGGALRYRAQGGPKPSGAYSDRPTELVTMRDKGVNRAAASVFGTMPTTAVLDSMDRAVGRRAEILRAIPVDAKVPGGRKLRELISARLDTMERVSKAARKAKDPEAELRRGLGVMGKADADPFGLAKGDVPGHPFRGNQYTAGEDDGYERGAVVIHGGRDFDEPDASRLGSGEPGGIRPLGNGLYGYVATSKEEARNALRLARVYAGKYGGDDPTLHAFTVGMRPGEVAQHGPLYDERLLTEGQRTAIDAARAADALPPGPERRAAFDALNRRPREQDARPFAVEPLPVGATEIAVRDLTRLERQGKWSTRTSDDAILADLDRHWARLRKGDLPGHPFRGNQYTDDVSFDDPHAEVPGWDNPPADPEARRYGGVVMDDEGRVLLREPAGHFGGYAWTFPKGGADGDDPVTAAKREVGEETGHSVRITGAVPGAFSSGGSVRNYFFLMRSTGERPERMDAETSRTRWATPEEARRLISETPNEGGRKRDLAVLEAALKLRKGDSPGHPFRGNQWVAAEDTTLYHATRTENVASIRRKGLLPMQTSNWVQQGTGERYGGGDVFAFTDRTDAVRWAAKMDWDQNSGMGTGKVSVVAITTPKGDKWKVDTADPLSQASAAGKWLRRPGKVDAHRISGSEPVTTDMIRSLTMRKGDVPGHPFRGNQYVSGEDGEPLVVYHGSVVPGMTADRLDPDAPHVRVSTNPRGIAFTSDQRVAANYRRPPGASYKVEPGAMIAAHLTMSHPLDITDEVKRLTRGGSSFGDAKRQALLGLRSDHDGIIFRGSHGNDEYVVFSRDQIHQITRKGDVPGHPFHGNQYTDGPSEAIPPGTAALMSQEERRFRTVERLSAHMSPEEAQASYDAVRDYSESAYIPVNAVLRGAPADTFAEDGYPAARVEKLTKGIERYMAATRPLAGVPLYRGTALPKALADGMVEGAEIRTDALWSASTDRSTADSFRAMAAHRGEPVFLEIERSRSAVPIHEATKAPHEGEALFPKGTRFRVVARDGRVVRLHEVEP